MLDGKIAGYTIAAGGLVLKAGTNDTLQSPVIHIIDRLVELCATVRANDQGTSRPLDGVVVCQDALSICEGAEILVVLTESSEVVNISLEEVAKLLTQKRLLDTCNIIGIDELKQNEFKYSSVGHAEG